MWFYIAIITSTISAISVILSKKVLKGVSPSVLTWFTLVISTPFVAYFAFKENIPSFNMMFLVGVLGSVIFYTISKIIQFKAIQKANLSEIYPLTSLGPIFTLIIAWFPPLNERPSVLAIIGILITLFGVYFLNIQSAKEGIFKPIKRLLSNKIAVLMLLSIVIDSVVIIFDKFAINNTTPQNTTFVLLFENILVIIGLLPILYFRNKSFLRELSYNKKILVILGILNAVATILAFTAVGGGNVSIVSTILKAQLLFVLLFSYIFFKDKPNTETIIGSIIMLIGVVLIKIGL
jgi:drug/metabolite transporter (DMT)-like permease